MLANIEIKEEKGIPSTFLQRVSSTLADTYSGLSGPEIIDSFCSYGDKWNVEIPFSEYPYGLRRKSEIFRKNLKSFNPPQQFLIISELCDLRAKGSNAEARKKLKLELYTKYGDLRPEANTQELDCSLIEETRHLLHKYPDALGLFNSAKLQYDHKALERETLDNLRMALESLLKEILGGKSLENQGHNLAVFLKGRKTSPEIQNIFPRLIEYYARYQNEHSKHKNNPVREEIEFIFELTASLIKYMVRISS